MSRSFWVKILSIGFIVTLLFVGWGFDCIRASKYSISLTYISNEKPYAKQEDVVEFSVRVTKFGKPCQNHEISATCSKGQMNVMLVRTDEDGYATFSYAPYNESRYAKAGEVFFEIADLSNSVFVEVHAMLNFSITLQSVEG